MQAQLQTASAVIWSCPAFDVIEGERERYADNPAVILKAGDQVACKGLRGHYLRFQAGSVVSYALESNACPIKAVERAVSRGHALHFLFGLAVSISAQARPRETYISLEIGERVRFEGRYFEVVKTGYEHLGLKEIEQA